MNVVAYRARKLSRHVLYNYRQGGIRQVLYKVGTSLRKFIFHNDDWLLLKLPLENYCSSPTISLTWKYLNVDGLRSINYPKLNQFPESIAERLNSGARCIAFYQDDTFVNLHWFCLRSLPIIPGLTISEQGCCGDFDVYTVQQFRGRGINTAANIIVASLAKEAGAQYMLVVIRPENSASIKSYNKAGYFQIATLSYRTRFGRKRLLRIPSEPF